MKHAKAIAGTIILSLVFIFFIIEIAPEIQRVGDNNAKIEERNKEIRAEQAASMGHPGLGLSEDDQYVDNPDSTSSIISEGAWYNNMP